MSEDGSLKELVVQEATEQVDVADLLGEGDVADGIDGAAVGASVGGRLGERIGRSIGEAVGESIHEAAAQEGDEGERQPREFLEDVVAAVREAIGDTVSGDDEGVVSSARESLEEVGDEAGSDVEGEGEETDGEQAESEDDGDEDERAESEGESEDDGDEDERAESEGESEDDGEAPSAEDLEDLRRETLEDFLGMMSYRDLQSVAKDVGVKANLAREEMTERIVETVADGETEEEPA